MTLQNSYKGKTVLVTGHTGFKGTWLIAWLKQLGAKVVGVSLAPISDPSHFIEGGYGNTIIDLRIDIRNYKNLRDAILDSKPDYIFHLAAQSLVRKSYEDPLGTWETNTIGTMHVLEALRQLKKKCSAIIITSDKCYENVEWVWGYREQDALGGLDPYSSSKGAAELAVRSYVNSFFPKESMVRIASARAGNVIGGGDWSLDRIVPDCIRAWSSSKAVQLRSPNSTRPWQHVLEPLSGYLSLGVALGKQGQLHGEAFNFGPKAQQNHSVLELVKEMALHWDKVQWQDMSNSLSGPYESGLLKLNCDKALHHLGWHAVMNFKETVQLTAEWYKTYYQNSEVIKTTTISQIETYTKLAQHHELSWSK